MKIDTDKSNSVIQFMKDHKIPLKDRNVVTERSHVTSSFHMAEVLVNDKSVMLGRYGDFHPGCHGLNLPDFSSPGTLSYLFEQAIKKSGRDCSIVVDDHWKFVG